MKPYTVAVEIDLPREEVIRKFENVDDLYHWQNGLQSVTHISGEPGQPGSKTQLVYIQGKNRIELLETIVRNDLPDSFDGFYSWDSGENSLENRFVELGPNQTRWESTCTYQLKSIMMKLMGLLFRGKFISQNQMFLDNFKAFCETGASVKGQ